MPVVCRVVGLLPRSSVRLWNGTMTSATTPPSSAARSVKECWEPYNSLQPFARVAQANAFAGAQTAFADVRTVVLHAQHQAIAVASCGNIDATFVVDLAHAVLDGVFHERLQDEVRYQRVEYARLYLGVDSESALKADLHDLQVPMRERQFLAERDFLLVRSVERRAQQLAQAGNHASDAAWVALHQRRNRVQRVEQEVRIELCAQGRQARIRELRLKLRRLRLQQDRLLAPRVIAQESNPARCRRRGWRCSTGTRS